MGASLFVDREGIRRCMCKCGACHREFFESSCLLVVLVLVVLVVELVVELVVVTRFLDRFLHRATETVEEASSLSVKERSQAIQQVKTRASLRFWLRSPGLFFNHACCLDFFAFRNL